MKRISLKVATLLLIGSMLGSSCIGSFSLFNKFAAWQTEMTSNKYVNGVIGWFTSILYPFCMIADIFVLNTIEFWSGSNPLASNVGKTQQVMGQDGRFYAVTILKNGYEIKAPTGEITLLTYDKELNAWAMTQNGETKELFRFNEDGKTISVKMQNGESRDFSLNEQGVQQAQMVAVGASFYAMN